MFNLLGLVNRQFCYFISFLKRKKIVYVNKKCDKLNMNFISYIERKNYIVKLINT